MMNLMISEYDVYIFAYFIASKSFLLILSRERILFSTQGEISLLPCLGTGKIIFPLEKSTCDHFCLTTTKPSALIFF